jgi:type IV pilus assembly protein PilO
MAITLNDIKKLSPKAKALIIILIIIIIAYFDWFYFLSAAMEKKTSLETKLAEVQSQVKEKEKNALQFNKYKADVAALTDSYKVALQKLPDQREIPGLFHSVAQAGKDAGIDFLLFEPKAAIPKALDKPPAKEEPKAGALLKPVDGKKPPQKELETFYEEIPVNVTVIGTFQNIVYFFEKVAKLHRIVNISDISMGERKDIKGKGYVINTACTIKTYMFVDKKESVSEKAK